MDKYSDLEKLVTERQFHGIVFDFDGTLFDLVADWHDLREKLRHEFQLSSGEGLKALLHDIAALHGHDALLRAYSIIEKYEVAHFDETHPNTELLMLAKKWALSGKKLGVFSDNMTATLEFFLKKEQLMQYFDQIIGKDKVTAYKPHPEGLQKILTTWKFTTADVLYIGNSETDRVAGEAAGVKTVII